MLQYIIHGYIIWNFSVVCYMLGSNTSRCLGNEPALFPPSRGGSGEGWKSSFGNMYAQEPLWLLVCIRLRNNPINYCVGQEHARPFKGKF